MKLTLRHAAPHDHDHARIAHLLPRLALAAALLIAAGAVWGQKATEMLIPIGQSSGLSGQHTLVARVQAVNAAERSLLLMQDSTPVTIRLDTRTPLWLDRSPQQQGNLKITLADVRPGMLAEVKFRLNDRRSGEAEWVKLQAAP